MTERFPEKDLKTLDFEFNYFHEENDFNYKAFKRRFEIGIDLEITKTSLNEEYLELNGVRIEKIDSIEKLKQLIELIG